MLSLVRISSKNFLNINPLMEEKKQLSTKKAVKKLLKGAKKHPNWYTPEEVLYAKMIKKTLKKK